MLAACVVSLAAALGGWVVSARFAAPALVLLYGGSAAWHLSGRKGFRGDRRGVQANRQLVRGAGGYAYFGALLGVGVITEMSSPLVWAGVLYSAVAGFSAAACYGLGFGLGRSSPVVAAIPVASRHIDQGALAVSFVWGFSRPARYVAIVTSIFGALIMLALAAQTFGVHL
jgi:hypothetical protein